MSEVIPINIQKHPKYPEMFYLKWSDGVLSEDFYNLTRAQDILANYAEYRYFMKQWGKNPFLKGA